jgi:hypothetical protein
VPAHLALQPGHLRERDVVRKEIEHPALLHPVRLWVAIEGHDLVDRRLVAQKCKWRDQGAGAHPAHNVELRFGKRVLGRHLMPPFEKARPERSPVPSARDDQEIEHRRFLLCARGVPVVLGLGAFEQPDEHSAARARMPFHLFATQFQQILLGNGVAFWEGTIAGQREASGECGRPYPCEPPTTGHRADRGGKENNYRSSCPHASPSVEK